MKVLLNDSDVFEPYKICTEEGETIKEVQKYFRYLTACGKSPNTVRSYAYHLCTYLNFCESIGRDYTEIYKENGVSPIDHLTAFMMWLQYPDYHEGIIHIDKEKPARSNKTVNIIVGTVLSFYDYLAANNRITSLELYRIQRMSSSYQSFLSEMFHHDLYYKRSMLKKPEPPKEVDAITRPQYELLLAHCHYRRDKIMLAIMFEGGLRISEVLGLHMEDLNNLEDGVIRIKARENNENGARVKNYAEGIIKLPDYVVGSLISYITEDIACYDSDFVFLNLSGKNKGKPIKPDTIEKLFDRLSRETGLSVHPHMLRHGFATEKLNAGWQMEEVQAYLRHKNVSSTQIYAQYTNDHKKELMKKYFEENEESFRRIADAIR